MKTISVLALGSMLFAGCGSDAGDVETMGNYELNAAADSGGKKWTVCVMISEEGEGYVNEPVRMSTVDSRVESTKNAHESFEKTISREFPGYSSTYIEKIASPCYFFDKKSDAEDMVTRAVTQWEQDGGTLYRYKA